MSCMTGLLSPRWRHEVCMNINTLSRHCEYLVSGQSRLWSTVSRCKVFFGAWKRDMLWVFTRTFKAPRNAAQHLSIIPKDLVGPCGTREMTKQSLIVPISASFFFLLYSGSRTFGSHDISRFMDCCDTIPPVLRLRTFQ